MTDIEVDLEDFCAAQEISKKPKCTVCYLPQAVLVAVNNSLRSGTDISQWLKTKGYPIGASTLRRHRRGDCLGG